jgi:hypothetical protein
MAPSFQSEQRDLLALSFEESEQGYIYYHNRWSRGVPVSAEEREAYLRIPALGSRKAWRKSLKGRQTLPPRAFNPVMMKLLAAMPRRMAFLGVAFGFAGLVQGSSEPNALLAGLFIFGGGAMLVFGSSIALARLTRSSANVR